MKIAIVNIDTATGVKSFIDEFIEAVINYTDFKIESIDIKKVKVSQLKQYNIIYFPALSASLMPYIWKIFFSRAKKVLTIHGWVKEESLQKFREEKNIFKKIKKIFGPLVYRIILFLQVFDLITVPSNTTRIKNNLKKALVITNAILIPDNIKFVREKINCSDKRIVFMAYSGIGGGKDQEIAPLVSFFEDIIKKNVSKDIALYIFGKIPPNLDINKLPKDVYFKGYVSREDFIKFIKCADLFITLKKFPDLGYAEMEAGLYGVPIAKLTTNNFEELEDQKTGLVAKNLKELSEKIIKFINNYPNEKDRLGANYYSYIKTNKEWKVVIKEWEKAFNKLISANK